LPAEKAGGPTKSLSPWALELLKRYGYPGNVRELINAIGRGYCMVQGNVIDVEHLPAKMRQARGEDQLRPQEEGRVREIYQAISAGNGTFEDLLKIPFKSRRLPREVVLQVIRFALTDTRGRYREALGLLGTKEKDYYTTMSFLKRRGCCADFRPFRRTDTSPQDM